MSKDDVRIIHGKLEPVLCELARNLWDSGSGATVIAAVARVHSPLTEREKKIIGATFLATLAECEVRGVWFSERQRP